MLYTLPLDVLEKVAADYKGSLIPLVLAGAAVRSFVPKPLAGYDIETNVAVTDEVTARFGLFEFPFAMALDVIDMYCQAHVRNTHLWCAGYTEDGSEQLWNVRRDAIAGVGVISFAIGSVSLSPGQYWLAYVGEQDVAPNPDINISTYDTHVTRTVVDNVSAAAPPAIGTVAVAAHTLPATFAPLGLTGAHDIFPQCRFRQTT